MDDKQNNKELKSVKNQTLFKTNRLIGVKYRSSVLESQLLYLGMLRVQDGQYIESTDGIRVEISAAEIKQLTGQISRDSLYRKLDGIAQRVTMIQFGERNEVEHSFRYFVLINGISYENGIFSMRFAAEMKEVLTEIKTYTSLPFNVVMSFKKNYSFRLYELLKKCCYYPSNFKGERTNQFYFQTSVAELKLSIGVIDANDKRVIAILDRRKNPTDEDYEKATTVPGSSMYTSWTDFVKRCLSPAVEEINRVSDILVSYEPVRQGYGGKVKHIIFTMSLKNKDFPEKEPEASTQKKNNVIVDLETGQKNNQEKTPNLQNTQEPESERVKELSPSPDQQMAALMDTCALLADLHLSHADILTIVKASDYNVDKIKEKYEMLKESRTDIDDVVGWLLDAIKKDYKKTKKAAKKAQESSTQKNAFTDYEQRNYDYDELTELWRKSSMK